MVFWQGVVVGVLLVLLIISLISIKKKCSYRINCKGGSRNFELCGACKGQEQCIIVKQRDDLLAMTRAFIKHPKGYDGICECRECLRKNKG